MKLEGKEERKSVERERERGFSERRRQLWDKEEWNREKGTEGAGFCFCWSFVYFQAPTVLLFFASVGNKKIK